MQLRFLPILLFTALLAVSCRQSPPVPVQEVKKSSWKSPEETYGSLLADVQMARIFPDGKTFVDCTPLFSPDEIRASYEREKTTEGFELATFVEGHFLKPEPVSSGFITDHSRTVQAHIEALWPVLTRQPADAPQHGTLIPLPHPYIVPGGRFGEIYYWDSYFTMLGLRVSGKTDMIRNIVDNFAYLIDTVGHIPNGNRTYFLSRSQPPFFSLMVGLLSEAEGEEVWKEYLPQLEMEYAFWMNEETSHRVVRMPDGTVLNRYWDDRAAPRPESFREDVETAQASGRTYNEIYTNLRAACESGWDFSSRWLTDGKSLTTIQAAQILPVDLNCLMFNLEKSLARAYQLDGQSDRAEELESAARAREAAIRKVFYDEEAGFFFDFFIPTEKKMGVYSMAAAFPLYFGIASPQQAESVARAMEARLLKPGGFAATDNRTGQQWDAPNGWAPLQWIGIQGLKKYGHDDLANRAKNAWISLNTAVYQRTGKMLEKYNVEDLSLEAGGGEYPVQDGFGWTNGVLLALMAQ